MKLGNARFCMTPKKEFYLIGYRSENRYHPATGVHDDIYANALLFQEDKKTIFLLSADVLEFEETMVEEVKTMLHERYGIDRDMVLLCATHNHSSIVSYHKSWYTKKFDQEYYDWLLAEICEAYETCITNLIECKVKAGKDIMKGFYGNRNHPGKLADNEVIVLQFINEAGKPFAGIVNWAVHSTVISAENTLLTSELAGNVSKALYEYWGYYPVMVVGAAGDCSNRNERLGNDYHELARVTKGLTKAIAEIPIKTSLTLKGIHAQTLFHTIHHDMKFVHEEIKQSLQSMQLQLSFEQDEKKKKVLKKRMENTAKILDQHYFHLDAKGLVLDFKDLQMFVFPGELGSAFGKELKQACPVYSIILGYTNGYYEYFMPSEEYGNSFETIGSPIPKGEPEKMIEKYKQASIRLHNGAH